MSGAWSLLKRCGSCILDQLSVITQKIFSWLVCCQTWRGSTSSVIGVLGNILGRKRVGMFNTWRRRALCAGAAMAVTLVGAVAGTASASSPVTAPFTECPKIGAAPSCEILLVINPDQSISVLGDPSVGPY